MDIDKKIKERREFLDKSTNFTSKYVAKEGLNKELIEKISKDKNEPEWMLKKRLRAYELFIKTEMPKWGPNLDELNLDKIIYYISPDTKESRSWDEVPAEIKETFDKLGIPEAEKKVLAGVGAQWDSEAVYHSLQDDLKKQGVVFMNMDEAVHKHPDLVKKYFMTNCVPMNLHKFSMLHAAVWSGGTFIYIPKGVKVDMPLQAYFRMNQEQGGQFEHTLIIADEDSEINYIEGCSAPRYETSSVHAGCVELYVMKRAKIKYSSIENWSKNVYNLNTKRANVYEKGEIEWLNGNMGSKTTMLYPASVLIGNESKSQSLGIAFASDGQNQDTGTKVIHLGKNTTSIIKSKSVSIRGGICSYRGLVKVHKLAKNTKSFVECDSLIIDDKSCANAYPQIDVGCDDSITSHEAKIGKISDEEIFYLMSRGYSEQRAKQAIVSGFTNEVVKRLPLEYAVELNKLIDMQMEEK